MRRKAVPIPHREAITINSIARDFHKRKEFDLQISGQTGERYVIRIVAPDGTEETHTATFESVATLSLQYQKTNNEQHAQAFARYEDQSEDEHISATLNIEAIAAPTLPLVLVSHIQATHDNHVDIASKITGEANADIIIEYEHNGSVVETINNSIPESGEYDHNKHFNREEENSTVLVKARYVLDPSSEHIEHIVVPHLDPNYVPDDPIRLVYDWHKCDQLRAQLANGSSIEEALQATDPSLAAHYNRHPYFILRETRNSLYMALRPTRVDEEQYIPKLCANYDGETDNPVSYSINHSYGY